MTTPPQALEKDDSGKNKKPLAAVIADIYIHLLGGFFTRLGRLITRDLFSKVLISCKKELEQPES